MKKIYMIASLLFMGVVGNAQPFTEQWTELAGTGNLEWFGPTNNDVNSLDYNPVTNKLLVARRGVGIFILNPETGVQEGQLSTTGVGTEGFKYSKIRVTSDGVIYAASLALGAGTWTIYRWANQAANPTQISVTVLERTGDAFSISGTGANTILYGSGAGNGGGTAGTINIYMLSTFNGISFTIESRIVVTTTPGGVNQWANRAIDPVTNSLTSDLWITAGGGPARRITVGPKVGDTRVGTAVFAIADGVGNGQASVGYGGMRHLTTPNNKKFLIFAGGNNPNAGTRMTTLLVTDEDNVTTYGRDSLYRGEDPSSESYVPNTNGTGDAAYKMEANGEYTVFYVSTNNGIQATKTGLEILPVTMGAFNAELVNQTARLSWNTASENNNRGFYVERSNNGIDFQQIGFEASKAVDGNSKLPLDYQFEDKAVSNGRNFYRLQQVDKDGKATYTDIKMVQKIEAGSFAANLRTNPIVNELSVSVFMKEQSRVSVALVNASGAVMQSTERLLVKGENFINMPATNLAKGVYFVTIRDAKHPENQVTLRVIK